ncbi:alpha/beta-hydrolase [Calocera viscosa TUFC12733]|uniref:Alpha/beta-hydrolase n=1 Tax=Calocera viscosa (strain TUFC12733) TaxID=1330018 RepID=A0A167JGK3_CALVF|nr:alpha/beta-hydrolase [Calocera viscosa TUFC12733]
MTFLSWLKRSLLYARLKLHYIGINLLIKVVRGVRLLNYRKQYRAQYLTISGSKGQGRLKLYLHSPPASSTADAPKPGPKPVHINYHAGGFCLDMHGFDAKFCNFVAGELGCYVVDADYRLAPDHPFPAAYDDCQRVLDWVRANETGMFDTSKITVGGFSAGANLALAVAGTVEEPVQGVVVFYPITDFTVPYRSKRPPPNLEMATRKNLVIPLSEGDLVHAAYLFDQPTPHTREMLADPRLSPLFAPPEKFPDKGRTMILSCEYDYLDEEAQQMGKVLEKAGREPEMVWVKGVGHGFDLGAADGTAEGKARDESWGTAITVLRRAQSDP